MHVYVVAALIIAGSVGTWFFIDALIEAENAPRKPAVVETADNDIVTIQKVEIYDGVRVSKSATQLNLSGRRFEGSLKAEIRQLTDLEVVDMSSNNFTGVPAEVGQLSKLRILNLSNNPITGLPHEIGNLQNLELLDLRGTDYAEADLEVIQSSLPSTTQVLTN